MFLDREVLVSILQVNRKGTQGIIRNPYIVYSRWKTGVELS